ncbi:ankyrin [Annulohypoxylon maeteangense]|uniref:ankyrin n=1 Tax=Annulohypoxylon maeteangense TaxID=1927788 RepID=UPI002007B142|nr:ankyrin [Annulohypoxylon maeteangense]KAI0880501.1 ankyrin [Annulohypoxylon maeteangense]
MARLEDLPHELFREIFTYLSPRDTSTVCVLNKRLHWLLFEEIFQSAYRRKATSEQSGTTVLNTLFFHALKNDSINLVEWILRHEGELDLNGYIPKYLEGPITTYTTEILEAVRATPNMTYLQLAILKDNPKVVSRLVKYGTDLNSNMGDYPDLTPLYMALAQCRVSSPKALDNALRIACTYAFPKTVHFLLKNMANSNSQSSLGYSALHYAVSKKLPYRRFENLSSTSWGLMVEKTVRALLDFNADVEFKTINTRIHQCGHNCWHSFNCDSSGQTALQLASGRGLSEAVHLLLDKGADPNSANGDGYSALYTALAQGHVPIAIRLLERLYAKINPIVHEQTRMTALHAACRFAVPDVVLRLLERGACVNAPDSRGITPLHEVLGQTCFGAEDEVLRTLDYLDEYGADPDIDTGAQIGSPRKLGEDHPIPEVRVMFIKEAPKECKISGWLSRPNPSNKEMQATPSIESAPKALVVQPATHVHEVESNRAPDHVDDFVKNHSASQSAPNDQSKKSQDRRKPRNSKNPWKNLQSMDSAAAVQELGIPKKGANDSKPKRGQNVKKYQNSPDMTRGSRHSGEINQNNSRSVEPPASQPTHASAARFWKDLPKQQAPKAEAPRGGPRAERGQETHQASNKARSQKTKWKPVEHGW